VIYSTTWGNGFPPSLSSLGGTGTTSTCALSNLLDPIITTAPYMKSGYIFGYTGTMGLAPAGGGCGSPGYQGYLVTAIPQNSYSGVRSFCSAEPGVIHVDTTGVLAASEAACEALPSL
jgi:hypothetical protein